MIYDGVLAKLLGIELAEMEQALRKQFGKKAKAVELNMGALKAGFDYAERALHQAGSVQHRADERDAREDSDRGQRRRGDRLHDGRRHGRGLVSDHAVLVAAARSLIGYMKKYRIDKETGQGDFRGRAGRRRDRVDRHGRSARAGPAPAR